MSDFNTLSVDKEKGTVSGRRDPEKEFQLLEKLGEGYTPSTSPFSPFPTLRGSILIVNARPPPSIPLLGAEMGQLWPLASTSLFFFIFVLLSLACFCPTRSSPLTFSLSLSLSPPPPAALLCLPWLGPSSGVA
jgi:hypothetical protein